MRLRRINLGCRKQRLLWASHWGYLASQQLQRALCRPPYVHPLAIIPATKRSYAEVAAGRSSILDGATFVYIRRGAVGTPLADSYSGPYEVMQREHKILLLQIGDKQEWVLVLADRLKPHLGTVPSPAQLPKRGRPTGGGRHNGRP